MRFFLSALLLLPLLRAHAQVPAPAPPQPAPILIIGATAHLGDGRVIENSALAFENGKITLVADAATVRIDRKHFGKIYDAAGKHVYPGFIAPDTRIGLVEIEAVRATQDFAEVGVYNPNARAIIAYNTDSEVIPTLRTNGILLAQITPAGGQIAGSSSVVQLDAWNWEDAAFRTDDGIHLNWPSFSYRNNNAEGEGGRAQANEYDKNVEALDRYFAEAQAYCSRQSPSPINLRFEAMRGLFTRAQTLYIHAGQARTMQEAVLFAEKYRVRAVLVGAEDAWLIADFLKTHQVSVILSKAQRLPGREDDDYDLPYKTAAMLEQAGVVFCLTDVGAWRQRNLPFQAGQSVAFGLPYEAAVRAITLNAAKILGIDERCGSLETGKDATLFISEGDALDMQSSVVTAAFIQGREISLDNKQKALYQRYEAKYRAPAKQ